MDARLEYVIAQIRGEFERQKHIHPTWWGNFVVDMTVQSGKICVVDINNRKIKLPKELTED